MVIISSIPHAQTQILHDEYSIITNVNPKNTWKNSYFIIASIVRTFQTTIHLGFEIEISHQLSVHLNPDRR